MSKGDEDSALFASLEESACPDPDVEFVVAFGSQVTGEATDASDFDIAVKFSDDLSSSERFEKRCFLSGDLQQEEWPFIDISDIETLPLDIAHDAVNGTLVCGDKDAFEQFRIDIEATFGDQRDDLRRQQRAVIDRIAEDGLRG
ncbi:nucleotidyltransferase domain-containing protein [Halogeometricum sp. S1BR25-6]|uniref:Nucleotidyltransferase domain-containing protein n=1 Tax=Halogeometricum salsisoli TaxID=2950536 RepID=A0ABU2GL76_9EURY|nr:nucleotidyltransferase domain-containing protein [Halogeometricum sp. S1BR25-6]MDS0301161.1 nucleotidyltransferase domain-containing protein [Halogeometricum sp. S1BR25-6]